MMKFPLEIIEADAKFWGLCYQGMNDPVKIAHFVEMVKHYDDGEHEHIWELSQKAATAFHGDKGIIGSNLGRVLYHTSLCESGGGKYDEQIGGPARGWWQVEPNSAFSVVKNSYWMWGPKCISLTNSTLPMLRRLSYPQMELWLKVPINCAVMAGAIYVVMSYVKGQIEYLW